MDHTMLGHVQVPDGSFVENYNNLFAGGGEGRNTRYVFTAEQDGTHFLKVGGRIFALSGVSRYRAGTFKVSVRQVRPLRVPTCTPNPGDLWCGVVTVELSADSFGYNGFLTPAAGALSDNDFDVGTNSYTIKTILVGSSTAVTPGALNFSLSDRLSAAERGNLVLHVGGAEFKLSKATPSGSSLRWADAGLDWSGKEYVIVRLREASS